MYTVLLSTFAFAAPSAFADVTAETAYYEAISQLAEEGVIVGSGSGFFEPERIITMAEALTILEKKFGNSDNLPMQWSDWSDMGCYESALFDAEAVQESYCTAAITYSMAGRIALSIKNMQPLPLNIYTCATSFLDPDENDAMFITCIISGYKTSVTSSEQLHTGMTRSEFCNFVVWTETLERVVPEADNGTGITITIMSEPDQYSADLKRAKVHSIMKRLPEFLLSDFAAKGYTIEVMSRDDYDMAVSNSLIGTMAYYSNRAGKGGKIVSTNMLERTFYHEFGHFIHRHTDYGELISAIFANKAEVQGVELTIDYHYAQLNELEFFAEAFACYFLFPDRLAANAPQTFELVNSIIIKEGELS